MLAATGMNERSLRVMTGSTQGMKLRIRPARKASAAALDRVFTSRPGAK